MKSFTVVLLAAFCLVGVSACGNPAADFKDNLENYIPKGGDDEAKSKELKIHEGSATPTGDESNSATFSRGGEDTAVREFSYLAGLERELTIVQRSSATAPGCDPLDLPIDYDWVEMQMGGGEVATTRVKAGDILVKGDFFKVKAGKYYVLRLSARDLKKCAPVSINFSVQPKKQKGIELE